VNPKDQSNCMTGEVCGGTAPTESGVRYLNGVVKFMNNGYHQVSNIQVQAMCLAPGASYMYIN